MLRIVTLKAITGIYTAQNCLRSVTLKAITGRYTAQVFYVLSH